ncbi:class I SAM-dependent methyltransferase [Candidatus Woesearchaeota archaeon]|nr:class I SAM-dependent methyltransferase [Candidatus Woesearchaeota archaeon]
MENYQRYSKFVEDWKKARFPARPSEEEMPILDRLMRGIEINEVKDDVKGKKKGTLNYNQGKKLLILGATPEFRDLGFKLKLKVTCADINIDMLEGMKQLMEFPNSEEVLVKCDWLNMPFEDNSFDLVFAEQSINIIEVEHFDDFLREAKRVLKDKGIFVLKAIVLLDENEENILKKAREQKRDIIYIYDKVCNMPKHYINNVRSHKDVSKYFSGLIKQGKISQAEYDKFIHHFGAICNADLKLHALLKEEFEKILKTHFRIREILYGKDFEKHSLHPIYVLEK